MGVCVRLRVEKTRGPQEPVRLFRGPAFRGQVSVPGAYFTRWQRVQDAAHRELAPASSSPVVALTILNCSAWNAGSARKESLPK